MSLQRSTYEAAYVSSLTTVLMSSTMIGNKIVAIVQIRSPLGGLSKRDLPSMGDAAGNVYKLVSVRTDKRGHWLSARYVATHTMPILEVSANFCSGGHGHALEVTEYRG